MAPTTGAVRYSHPSLKMPVATIGPSARAGLKGAPVRAPPMRMLKVSVIPIARGARLPARPATAVLSTNAAFSTRFAPMLIHSFSVRTSETTFERHSETTVDCQKK